MFTFSCEYQVTYYINSKIDNISYLGKNLDCELLNNSNVYLFLREKQRHRRETETEHEQRKRDGRVREREGDTETKAGGFRL